MRNKLTAAAVTAAFLSLCFSTGTAMDAGRSALAVCAGTIVPSLFPFFILSILLNRLGLPQLIGHRIAPLAGRLFGVSGAGASALPVGLLGGYPLGAGCVASLCACGEISAEEAERLLLFCNNSGPAFLVGAIGGGVFGSAHAGLLLYLAHALAAVLTGLLFRQKRPCGGAAQIPPPKPFSAVFPAAVRDAVGAILNVCGFVVCFSVLLGLLESWGLYALLPDAPASRALVSGFLELGSAVAPLRALPCTPSSLALAALLVGWGGLSVHCQTAALFADAPLSLRRHSLGRLCSALLSAAFAYALAPLAL